MPTNTIDITNFVELTNIITNTMIETNSITHPNDPALWFTGIGTGLTALSAFIMWCSVHEMKKQREQIQNQYNNDIYQKDTNIYREYTLKITKEWDRFHETYNQNNIANSIIILLKDLATYIRKCLFELSFRSVYREKLQELLQKTESYIDNFEKTTPQEILEFIPKIINTLAETEDYISTPNSKRHPFP